MWRQNNFQGNSASDQSISEDEDFNFDLLDDCASLGGGAEIVREKEDGLQLQSRLEILKGVCFSKVDVDNNFYNQKEGSSSLEDDVEVPDSPNKGDYHVSSTKTYEHIANKGLISDDEESYELSNFSAAPSAKRSHCSFGRGEQDGELRWSFVTKEAEALIDLNKSLSHFSRSSCSKEDQSCRGARPKAKPRFSFGLPHKGGTSWRSVLKDENDVSPMDSRKPERLKSIDHETLEQTIDEFLEDSHGYRDKQSKFVPDEEEAPGQRFQEHSMAELLDDLQDKTSPPRGHSKISSRTRRKRVPHAFEKHSCSLGDRTIDSEDLLEFMVADSSSNDEADPQNLKLLIPEMKKTMADRFHEALGATSLSNEVAVAAASKPLCSGLFGKLQQVMQQEKEKDLHFLKKLQSGAIEEPSCIDVEIMSRYLDAKLTVCHCSFIKATEDIQSLHGGKAIENEGRKIIVIFNQRICSNVDLEIGNLIRIYPQWKEVQVMGGAEKIVLSSYFSQI